MAPSPSPELSGAARSSALPESAHRALGGIARSAVVAAVRGERYEPPAFSLTGALAEPGASFVTLLAFGELRGCIGSIEARRPLALDVAENARAAALDDLRFAPVGETELPALEVELSLLTRPEPFLVGSRAELVAGLAVGVDGLVLEELGRRATFLPSVWDQLGDPEAFVLHLERKAGLPAGSWSPARRALRYRTVKIAVGRVVD